MSGKIISKKSNYQTKGRKNNVSKNQIDKIGR